MDNEINQNSGMYLNPSIYYKITKQISDLLIPFQEVWSCQNNMGNVEYSFNLINTGGQIIKKYPNQYHFAVNPNSAVGFSHENLFYRFNGRLFKKEVYSDTIYVLKTWSLILTWLLKSAIG